MHTVQKTASSKSKHAIRKVASSVEQQAAKDGAWPLGRKILEHQRSDTMQHVMQVFNGCAITNAERATSHKMFQPLQAARTAAAKSPFVSMVYSPEAYQHLRLYTV